MKSAVENLNRVYVPTFQERVAALLLWLTGLEVDEDAAASIRPADRPTTHL